MILPVACLECKWFKTLNPIECSKHCEKCEIIKERTHLRSNVQFNNNERRWKKNDI